VARDVQAHDSAADRRPEGNVDLIFEIGTRLGAFLGLSRALTAAKDRTENVAEAAASAPPAGFAAPVGAIDEVGEIEAAKIEVDAALAAILRATGEAARKSSATCRSSTRTGVCFRGRGVDIVRVEADLIVDLAFLGIAENVVGFGKRLELLLGRLVPGIDVGMVLARQFSKRLADVVRRSALLYAEYFVLILLRGIGHCAQC
jgi:hypothetical protein